MLVISTKGDKHERKKIWGFGSILFFTFSGSVAAGAPEGPFSHNYDIGILSSVPYTNTFSGMTTQLLHSYTFDLDAPAMVKADLLNLRPETGVFLALTHTLFYITLFDSENHRLYDGITTKAWTYGSTLDATVSGELPAGKDYFVLITGSQTNDTDLAYAMKISVISSAVPEPETYAMFLAGLDLMGFIARRKNPE